MNQMRSLFNCSMKVFRKIWQFILFDTYGNIALSSFIICVVTGIFLAIPYNVEKAYDSIAVMLITNLPAVVFRNMHYWSAQFFLVFTFLHTLEHLKLKTSSNTNSGQWFRLVSSLIFVIFVMLSGFILKADADSFQAHRILESLFLKIPIIGIFFAKLILGDNSSFQLIYVHHIATATIFLIYIIYEHTATLWGKRSTFLILLAIFTLLGFFAHAPLHDNLNPILKGPWYFVGLQEILHWTSQPGWIWILVVVVLFLIFISYYVSENRNRNIYRLMVFFTLVYFILTIIGYYFRGENWEWRNPFNPDKTENITSINLGFQVASNQYNEITSIDIPVVQDKREACMICHSEVSGFSPSHDPNAIGCTSCHQGNPFSLDKNSAHQNMELIPGNLHNAKLSCGTTACHEDITERIYTSLMATNSGIVSVDRFVFGENHSPDILSHIKDIGYSAADKHLRDLCANCHLGNEKMETAPIDQLSRGGGCTACHLNYSPEGESQHFSYLSGDKAENLVPTIHPSLDLQISNNHCFGCHSRSGRIATNYEGWHETLLSEEEIDKKEGYRVLQDKRVFEFIGDDVHHAAGLDCIDCHDSYEAMGDGNSYLHEEHAVKISCEDCHFDEANSLISYDEMEVESKKIYDLRKFNHQDKKMIKGRTSGRALVNTYLDNEKAVMISKNSGSLHPLNPPASICTKNNGHESLSCSSCHTSWAPSCIGCHNAFDKQSAGYDLLEGKATKGEWVEFVGEFIARAPTLGVRLGDQNKVEPAIPGMIMTIDKESFDGDAGNEENMLFHRLYAPVAPHTSSKKGRNCISCHANPVAVGYGSGDLIFTIEDEKGRWLFTPAYEINEIDGLPEDAWIPFYSTEQPEKPEKSYYSTRTDFRPFTTDEQQRILRVGSCFNCHDEESEIMMNSLDVNFDEYLKSIDKQCILPQWQD